MLWTLCAAGWVLAIAATFAVDHLELTGLRQAGWAAPRQSSTELEVRGMYAYVRHPLMTGLLLAFWATPDMSTAHLLFAAATFYDSVKILGTRYVQGTDDAVVADSWIEADPTAPPIWARFYDLDPPFRPFFCGRDGVKKYALADVEVERRGGYAWYGNDGTAVLGTTYPSWLTKWSITPNVLAGSDGGTGVSDAGPPAAEAGTGGDDAGAADGP